MLHAAFIFMIFCSLNYCDVDENGVRFVILCRVIMGNVEVVLPGSKQAHPSCENYDSGVDDLNDPRRYIVWGTRKNTHVCPQYVVSFKISSDAGGNRLLHWRSFIFPFVLNSFVTCLSNGSCYKCRRLYINDLLGAN